MSYATPEPMTATPIGWVENEFDKPAPMEEIGAVVSRIVIESQYLDGLDGLQNERRVLVIYQFHLSDGFDLRQHPRGDRTRPKRGVFALRSPRRPNPIGVCEADLLEIDRNILLVKGLDAINNTPVLDLKPAWHPPSDVDEGSSAIAR